MNNNIIKLKGITSKGKNRIREHGELWEIYSQSASTLNNKILLKSINTGYLKWGPNPDFDIDE